MHRNKEVSLRLIRNLRPIIQRNVVIIGPRINHFRSQPILQQFPQALRDFQYQIFLQQSAAPHGAQVPSTMAGVDDDAQFGHACPQLQVFFARRRNHDR